jgi:hypothetical protein
MQMAIFFLGAKSTPTSKDIAENALCEVENSVRFSFSEMGREGD